jgi:5-methylcytosine-specific restriction enzyme B
MPRSQRDLRKVRNLSSLDFGIQPPAQPAGIKQDDSASVGSTEVLHALDANQLAHDLSLDKNTVEDILDILSLKGALILYGSPGTGKSHIARILASSLAGGAEERILFVQFHPSYSYEEFIQGIRPEPEGGGLSYLWKDGHFKAFVDRARMSDKIHVSVLDEFNRGDPARVLGELLYLLEYRANEITLLSGDQFSVPRNVLLVCTMNTADKSVTPMDHALRRRFGWVRLRPRWNLLSQWWPPELADGITRVMTELNREINNIDLEIGSGYLRLPDGRPATVHELGRLWRTEIEPYIEDIFRDEAKRTRFSWGKVRGRFEQAAEPEAGPV